MSTDDTPRVFPIPLKSITMSERRMMATKFGVNWDAIEVDLTDVPRPADEDNPTEAEKIAAAKVFSRIVGPNEKFALLWVAVKRQEPAATEAEMSKRADAGEWVLSLSATDDDGSEVADAPPLPAPSATISSTTS